MVVTPPARTRACETFSGSVDPILWEQIQCAEGGRSSRRVSPLSARRTRLASDTDPMTKPVQRS